MAEEKVIAHQQNRMDTLSQQEYRMSFAILILLLFALFFHLGVHPLKHEEPRRALVALEMLFRANWIVPTELGALYYNKPPLYNWLLIGAFQLFGNYSEFTVRFFSVVSLLGMGGLIYLSGKRYVGRAFGVYSTLFFLICVEFLFYFSLTGEIDFFYSLITFAQFLAIYHFYYQQKFTALFLSVYVLAALGTLTKGLPSVAFTGISLLAWMIYQRDFKRLFTIPHFASILVYLFIVGGYFWIYSWYEDPIPYLKRLFWESSSRTVAGNGFLALVEHLITFPAKTLLNIMPATLLLIFAFNQQFISKIKEQPFLLFCLLIFVSNILLYWLSPGTRARYIYMLYPFPVMIFVFFYLTSGDATSLKKRKILDRITLFLIILVIALGPVLLFIPEVVQKLEAAWVPALLTTLGGLVILYLYKRFPLLRTLNLILLTVWIRVIFDLTIIPIRDMDSSAARDEADAAAIQDIAGNKPLHVLEGSMISRSTVFYLERSRQEVLGFQDQLKEDSYYMAYENSALLKGFNLDILYTFQYEGETVYLLKIK